MLGSEGVRGWLAVVASGAVLVGMTAIGLPALPGVPQVVEQAQSVVSGAAPEIAVQELLARRAAAVRAGDEAAFAATVDPLAPEHFRQRQLAWFRALATVPLAEWSYQLDVTEPPVPGGVWRPDVALRYALAGVDGVPTQRSVEHSFVRRDGSWFVADDSGRHRWRGPWDFGPCHVARTANGLVIGHEREPVERVARQLDAVVRDVTGVWGPGWDQRVGVLIPASQEELRAMVGAEFGLEGIAAVAVADRVDTAAHRVEGPRVVLNPRTAAELSDAALEVVLRHEVTHIATRPYTVDGAPLWVREGFADYVGYRGTGLPPRDIAPALARQLRTSGPPEQLPGSAEFHQAGRRLDLAYQQSWSLVRHLVDRFGEQRVVQLYRRVAATDSPAGVEAALRGETGLTTAELTADWAASLPAAFGS